jgi:diacylglycerol kinase
MKQLVKSFYYAWNGLRSVWQEEQNFRIETGATLAVLGLSYWLRLSLGEWAVILLCVIIVLAAEMVNTAIEDLCNKVEPNHDPMIGRIKDIMAGFTLLVSLGSAVVGILIIVQHI